MEGYNFFTLRAVLIVKRIIGLTFLLIIILLSAVIEIRLGRINNKTIGHFAAELDISILLNRKNLSRKRTMSIYYFTNKYSTNTYFEKLVREKVKIMPSVLLEYAYQFMVLRKQLHKHVIPSYDFNLGLTIPDSQKLDKLFWLELAKEPPLLRNDAEEKNATKNLHLNLGSQFEEFACFHVRNSEFKIKELRKRGFSENHIESDKSRSEFRNSEIKNFILSAKFVSSKGVTPIQVGRVAQKLKNFFLIDYSNSDLRSDKNDILLAANCKFMVCTLSGFSEVSKIFRVPIFYIDVGDFLSFKSKVINSVFTSPIVLPKVLKSRRDESVLSIKQIRELGLFDKSVIEFEHYLIDPKCPIKLEKNSPDAIFRSIELGVNYLDKKSSDLENSFQYGQRLFSELYSQDFNPLLPAISPFWPNALKGI